MNDYRIPNLSFTYKATVAEQNTKTGLNYFWLLPKETDQVVKLLLAHEDTGFGSYKTLQKALLPFYEKQVLGKADVPVKSPCQQRYSMRTIRAFRATQYVKLKAEYKAMGWKPAPPNPLQHTNDRMTLDNYAEKGSDNIHEARKRCALKYGGNPKTRLPWMAEYAVAENHP